MSPQVDGVVAATLHDAARRDTRVARVLEVRHPRTRGVVPTLAGYLVFTAVRRSCKIERIFFMRILLDKKQTLSTVSDRQYVVSTIVHYCKCLATYSPSFAAA